MRWRDAGRILLGGSAAAGMLALPPVNLAASVVATAFMVHRCEALPRKVP
jgi:hypothetical protein